MVMCYLFTRTCSIVCGWNGTSWLPLALGLELDLRKAKALRAQRPAGYRTLSQTTRFLLMTTEVNLPTPTHAPTPTYQHRCAGLF